MLDEQLLAAAPGLKWIGRMGSGMEVIDVAAATEKGIACYSSPEGNCNAVGEHAMGMLLSLIRRIRPAQNQMQRNIWLRDENRGIELEGKTAAIIGFGHTGRSLAKKLAAFDVRILAFDKYDKADYPPYVERCDSLQFIYDNADIVSFHVPLQEDTVHYFNDRFLDALRKQIILINTSRGPVVSLKSVYSGLQSGKITGLCLDVFETEPVTKLTGTLKQHMEEMVQMENVVVTPHIAGYTYEALYKMGNVLLNKITKAHHP
jgi:D-3-phosphoglycerate dehydrogenase